MRASEAVDIHSNGGTSPNTIDENGGAGVGGLVDSTEAQREVGEVGRLEGV